MKDVILASFRVPMSEAALGSDDAVAIVDEHYSIVERLLSDHHFNLGELPESSAQAYAVTFYIRQVENGGHGQFLANDCRHAQLQHLVDQGLKGLGATGWRRLFRRFTAFLDADPARAQAILVAGGFGDVDPQVGRFDKSWLRRDRHGLIELLAGFIRDRADVEVVPAASLAEAVAALERFNPWAEVRRQACAAELARYHKGHLRFPLAALLCAEVGRQAARIVCGWESAPGEWIDSIETADGMVWMRSGTKVAVLGLGLGDVTGFPRLPGMLATARFDGQTWSAYRVPASQGWLARQTPRLRALGRGLRFRP